MRATLDWLSANPRAWIEPVAIFAAVVMAALLVRHLLLRALRAWAARAQSRPGTMLVAALRVPTLIWIVILGVHVAIQSSQLPEYRSKGARSAVDRFLHVGVRAPRQRHGPVLRGRDPRRHAGH